MANPEPRETQTKDGSEGAGGLGVVPFMHPALLFPRIILLLAITDLVGWALHLPLLTSVVPRFSSMKPNTALALGLLAICCHGRSRRSENQTGRLGWIPGASLAVASLVSGGTLLEYASGRSLGLDELIMRVPLDYFGTAPGRMALGTALCLTLTSFALGLLDRSPRLSLWMLLTANVITASALLGFVINAGPLTNVPWLRSVAVPTALCLTMLGISALALRPERKPVALLFPSDARRGKSLRPIFNAVILPILVTLPSVVAMRSGLPEATLTFIGTALALYSAETWFVYMESTAGVTGVDGQAL